MAGAKRRWPWQARDIKGDDVATPSDDELDQTRNSHTERSRPAPSRWTEGGQTNLSPYGFSEDDAGLRQVESGAWKRSFSTKSSSTKQRFIPKTNPVSGNGQRPDRARSRFSLTFAWQIFCAAVLVGAGYFVEHNSKAMSAIGGETQAVFNTDYTSQVQPTVDRAFADMHLSIPSFGASTRLHEPLAGSIVDDYGPNHPEIWISGNADEPIMAAGSGTVLTVANSGGEDVVKIDNGSYGTTIYAGLGNVSVKVNEYVNAGEAIGRLPTTPSHPSLRFSIVKNGQYENPHDLIAFSGHAQ